MSPPAAKKAAASDGDEPTPYETHKDAGTGDLAARIARVGGAVGRLEKDGKVEGRRGFGYATIGAMAAALAPRLADEGIALIPREVQILDSKPMQLEGDSYGWRWLTSLRVTWLITANGEQFEAVTLGKSLDSNGSEKDTNQALTFARINLYKILFNLSEQNEDPEQKGAPRQGGGGASAQGWDGEVPDVSDATVSGQVVIVAPGRIALSYEINPRGAQQAINAIVGRQLGGKWESGERYYAMPEASNEQAVKLARAIGLAIPPKVAERYPPTGVQTHGAGEAPAPADPPTAPAEDGSAPAPEVPADAQGVATEQIGFPTAEEAAADQARRAKNDPHS